MRRLRSLLPHLILVTFSAVILVPLLWVLRVSLTDKRTAYRLPPEFSALTFENYLAVFQDYSFAGWFTNSMTVALAATLISLPAAATMAYASARFRTGGPVLWIGVLAGQMLPPIILVLPMFMLFGTVLSLDGRIAIIVAHVALNLPFMAWMMTSFFEGDIRSLEEAARVDGASRLQALVRIALPVAAPGILAAALLGFILSWNEFLYALVLGDYSSQTLPVGLAGLETHAGVEIASLAAAALLALAPVLILLPLLRKYLIKGLSLGALK
ncbi:carbohydrate ABC transporter permease [Rhodospirillum rubrum]|uniref:Binding-protein-dependent transport systems inner membrane component n=1 Tax=Rhodospirillum rubrum (strain ATCC 11170 / ATH 1.1.1 / DSM 467 / LMG 4362 / NCIMB 8255 / S1) TaxID=269796 RepID=Q2RUY1_RHORT|nr:carbohydrate ABC transporter permease [Rhodospirillum rubrum]ABC22064.1 Binding-protein-dependent transport systems inner membrane component [Rhodospirillum rubrum ATCC 11170]AEO47776.1 binding-protein dependent transport system inner membrane protein [Rhodospirillum rubrum F11]MBK5953647.1 carbohydrate ABC transporter permease [Rhodospirillum rubrum]QXG81717.1 carbohydrate ABC transporter permease [Rhodospirillum rubrum]HAQ01400.1 carbohydrate ABC transporter permease [Rhodospirillum rubru